VASLLFLVFLYVGHALADLGYSWFGPAGVQLPSLVTFGIVPLLFGILLLVRLLRVGVGPAAPPWRRNAAVALLVTFAVTACGVWCSWLFARDMIEVPLALRVTATGFECQRSSGMYSDAGWLPAPLFTTMPCGMRPGKYEVTVTSASHMLLAWRAVP
jgi:hypothetical protein